MLAHVHVSYAAHSRVPICVVNNPTRRSDRCEPGINFRTVFYANWGTIEPNSEKRRQR